MTDQPPLSAADAEFATRGHCGDVAAEIAALTGWETVILTGDGEAWTHAAVRTDTGSILDASGVSDGGHILNDDFFYESFQPEELEDGEVWLADYPADLLRTDELTPDAAELAARIARDIVRWAVEQGHGGAPRAPQTAPAAPSAREQGRVARGVPAGGQFAAVERAEAAISLR